MRLTLALLMTPLFVITAHADEIRLECRNYGGMESFAKTHSDFPKQMCESTGGGFFCEKAVESDKQIKRCLATGKTYTHTQYITFNDNNLTGTAKKWAKPCWRDETDVKELKISVSPDLTMTFYGDKGTPFNVNMRTKKAGYLTDREHSCEIINLSETPAKSKNLDQTHKEAEQGDADVQFDLGVKYAYGRGVPKNPSEAERWYRKAADQGHDEALYRKSANQGNSRAQYYLGNIYYGGKHVPKDEAEALKWYRKAADQGHKQANTALKSHEQNLPLTGKLEVQCFNLIQNKVAWSRGGSTKWVTKNLNKLCRGTTSPATTVSCFKTGIQTHNNWSRAINNCKN